MSQTKEWGILPAQTLARELFVRSRLEGHYVDKTHALEKHLRAPADADPGLIRPGAGERKEPLRGPGDYGRCCICTCVPSGVPA